MSASSPLYRPIANAHDSCSMMTRPLVRGGDIVAARGRSRGKMRGAGRRRHHQFTRPGCHVWGRKPCESAGRGALRGAARGPQPPPASPAGSRLLMPLFHHGARCPLTCHDGGWMRAPTGLADHRPVCALRTSAVRWHRVRHSASLRGPLSTAPSRLALTSNRDADSDTTRAHCRRGSRPPSHQNRHPGGALDGSGTPDLPAAPRFHVKTTSIRPFRQRIAVIRGLNPGYAANAFPCARGTTTPPGTPPASEAMLPRVGAYLWVCAIRPSVRLRSGRRGFARLTPRFRTPVRRTSPVRCMERSTGRARLSGSVYRWLPDRACPVHSQQAPNCDLRLGGTA
jgi:hypothetical protein